MLDNKPERIYGVYTEEVRNDKTLKSSAKIMYATISAFVDETGTCEADYVFLADKYGCTPKTVKSWAKQLEKAGHITIEKVDGVEYFKVTNNTELQAALDKVNK